MIFNKDNKGAEELRKITGSYFANNDFSKVEGYITEVEDELSDMIGIETMISLEQAYKDGKDSEPLRWAQRAVAGMATLRLYRSNDLSHEDDGRKFKIDSDNERIPWEWQLDRDDRIILDRYYKSVGNLLRTLADSDIDAYKKTSIYISSQKLLIRNAKELFFYGQLPEDYYLYHTMIPCLTEAQKKVEKAYGDGFDKLVSEQDDINVMDEVSYAASMAECSLAIAIMIERNGLQKMPYSIVKVLHKDGGISETAPTEQEMKNCEMSSMRNAKYWIGEMKKLRDIASSSDTYTAMIDDKNDKNNKFFRL